jgi:hypothetical protein
MTVAGKVCDAFESVTPSGVTTYAGTDHILLYCQRNLQGENWLLKAVTIDESAKVPEWKFSPPAGYVEQETHF